MSNRSNQFRRVRNLMLDGKRVGGLRLKGDDGAKPAPVHDDPPVPSDDSDEIPF